MELVLKTKKLCICLYNVNKMGSAVFIIKNMIALNTEMYQRRRRSKRLLDPVTAKIPYGMVESSTGEANSVAKVQKN